MLTAEIIEGTLGDRTRVTTALHAADRLARQAIDADILQRCEYRVAQLLGVADHFEAPEGSVSAAATACVDFTEQWVIDVASMPSELVAQVREHLGADAIADFVHALLVVEQRIRLAIAWAEIGLSDDNDVGAMGSDIADTALMDLRATLAEWQAAVVCLDTIDPVTTELVRLRCANHHDCHT